jgi:hypothetical protein
LFHVGRLSDVIVGLRAQSRCMGSLFCQPCYSRSASSVKRGSRPWSRRLYTIHHTVQATVFYTQYTVYSVATCGDFFYLPHNNALQPGSELQRVIAFLLKEETTPGLQMAWATWSYVKAADIIGVRIPMHTYYYFRPYF